MYFLRFYNLGTPLARCFADRDLRGDLLPGLDHCPIPSLTVHPLYTRLRTRALCFTETRRNSRRIFTEPRPTFPRFVEDLQRRYLLGESTVIIPSDISRAGWLPTRVSGGEETPY